MTPTPLILIKFRFLGFRPTLMRISIRRELEKNLRVGIACFAWEFRGLQQEARLEENLSLRMRVMFVAGWYR
jgi:hypothetical protein